MVTVPTVAVAPSPSTGQDTDLARLSELTTVGTWSRDDEYGDIRLLTLREGFEVTRDLSLVDWIEVDPDDQVARIVATAILTDCAGVPVEGMRLAEATQPDFGEPVVLTLTDGTQSLIYEVTMPQSVRLRGC